MVHDVGRRFVEEFRVRFPTSRPDQIAAAWMSIRLDVPVVNEDRAGTTPSSWTMASRSSREALRSSRVFMAVLSVLVFLGCRVKWMVNVAPFPSCHDPRQLAPQRSVSAKGKELRIVRVVVIGSVTGSVSRLRYLDDCSHKGLEVWFF